MGKVSQGMDALKKGVGIPLQNYDVYIYIVAELFCLFLFIINFTLTIDILQ